MNWEAVGAISTAFTGLVILVTAIYAARQVQALNEQSRALGTQIEHLRRATQLDGTLAVFEEIFSTNFLGAYRFVMHEFDERMKDDDFHAAALAPAPDDETHKELQILRHMERIGTLIKNDLLEADVILDFASSVIWACWEKLEPLVIEQRRAFGGPFLWENFEYIAKKSRVFDSSKATKGMNSAQMDA